MAIAVDTYFSTDKVVAAGHCTSSITVFSEDDLASNYVLGDVVKSSGLVIHIFRGVVVNRQILVTGLKIIVITEV